MTPEDLRNLRRLEGRHVAVRFADGTKFPDCELVSAGRFRSGSDHPPTLWVAINDRDQAIPIGTVAAVDPLPAA